VITTWRPEDYPDARRLWGDPEVMRYIDARGALNEREVADKLQQEIDRQDCHGVQYWKVVLKDTGETIGCCGLRPSNAGPAVYELGFHIMSSHWRHGYAAEAAAAVIRYAFDEMRASLLVAGHNPRNEASRAVLEKLGFQYTGDEYYAPTSLHHPSYALTADSARDR